MSTASTTTTTKGAGTRKTTTRVAKRRAPKRAGSTGHQGGRPSVSPAERTAMIAKAAYYNAEARGFEPGYELEDWLSAEQVIEVISGR